MDIIAVIIALIVPVGVAIWTVRSSAKDTAKQIAALEERIPVGGQVPES